MSILRDITGLRRAEEALRESEERFRAAFEYGAVAMAITLPDGIIQKANQAFCQLLGYTGAELTGMRFAELTHPDDIPENMAGIQRLINGKVSSFRMVKRYFHKDGSIIWADMSTAAVRDSHGKGLYIVTHIQDITERKKADEALRESEERLRQATRVAQSGIFDHDHIAETVYWSPMMREIYGWGPYEKVTMAAFLDCVHPDDREWITEAIRRAHDPAGSGLFDVEHRIIRRDGAVRWVSTRCQTFFEDRGGARRAVRTIGASVDITGRKKADEALRVLSSRQDAILKAVPDIIMEVDNNKVYTWANPAGYDFFGEDVIGKQVAFYFEGKQSTSEILEPVFKGNDNIFFLESLQRRKDGAKRLLSWRYRVLKDNNGNVTGALSSARDITETKQADEKLRTALLEKETLLKELYHRTKNNMQVISSVVGLQARRVGEPGVIQLAQETRNRIRAISLVHEKLYQSSNLSNIDMNDYVRDLTGLIFSNYAVEGRIFLDLKIEAVRVPIEFAIPCGLIFNELISNSVKHAFPGNRAGKIRVELYRDIKEFHLEYSDNGVGFGNDYETLKNKSLGLQVIETLVKQVGGEMEVTRQNGAGCNIKFGKLIG